MTLPVRRRKAVTSTLPYHLRNNSNNDPSQQQNLNDEQRSPKKHLVSKRAPSCIFLGLLLLTLSCYFPRHYTSKIINWDTKPLEETLHNIIDDTDNIIIGLGAGYNLQTYQRFIKSLRNNYSGQIHLGLLPNVSGRITEYLRTNNVIIHHLNVRKCQYSQLNTTEQNVACIDPYPNLKLNWASYALAKDWLQEPLSQGRNEKKVMLASIRNISFQQNPFLKFNHGGLNLFELSSHETTRSWKVLKLLQKCKGFFDWEVPLLSSSVVMGNLTSINLYLDTMLKEINENWILHDNLSMSTSISNSPCYNPDQHGDELAIHNYLFYNGQIQAKKVHRNREGYIHSISNDDSLEDSDVKDFSGNLLNRDRSISTMVHHDNLIDSSWLKFLHNKLQIDDINSLQVEEEEKRFHPMGLEYFTKDDMMTLQSYTNNNMREVTWKHLK